MSIEFDRSNERNWYRVHIDWIASFVVCSYSEESAMLKVDYYCQANPKLGLNVEPENKLPLCPEWAKPLEPFEVEYYDTLGDNVFPVRLVEDNRKNGCTEHGIPKQKTAQMFGQLSLINMNSQI